MKKNNIPYIMLFFLCLACRPVFRLLRREQRMPIPVQIAPQTGRFCGAKRTRSGASGHLNLMI